MNDAFINLYNTIKYRRDNPAEKSYTCYLFEQGLDKILKKCGEECSETIIAAKNGNKQELVAEIADLHYHLTVLMVEQGLSPADIAEELEKRSKKTGNLKEKHVSDPNS
ncbi:MAG: phosphoribosyl-ATP diphosphatase [Acutalibacteraceae bacterium]|jgi:phosphoribosyl-ATP pyrophosphohydrolase